MECIHEEHVSFPSAFFKFLFFSWLLYFFWLDFNYVEKRTRDRNKRVCVAIDVLMREEKNTGCLRGDVVRVKNLQLYGRRELEHEEKMRCAFTFPTKNSKYAFAWSR